MHGLNGMRASFALRSSGIGLMLALLGCGSDSDDKGEGKDESGATASASGAPGKCESASTTPCSSFVSPTTGAELMLGKYGAVMEQNLGAGFENPIAAGDSDGGLTCQLFAATFAESPEATQMLLDTKDTKFDLYTVYRPAKWVDGEKYPIVTWGNGTCAQPEGYGALLRYVASQGFVVVAANSRWVGSGAPMLKALDFALAANADPASPYYQRLDPSKIAAMGHSQGGMGTTAAAKDSRVQSVVIFNGGASASKPFLTISGEKDIFTQNASSLATAVMAAPKAAYLFYHMIQGTGTFSGHLTLMTQPERVTEPTVAWLRYTLLADAESRGYFSGATCKLCGRAAEYEFGQNGVN